MSAPIYAFFCGRINQENASKIAGAIGVSTHSGAHLHLLFQSDGGVTTDGIYLYNLFRSTGEGLTVYVGGSVQSIATIAYLGAHQRIISKHGAIMLHGVRSGFDTRPTIAELENAASIASLEEKRMSDILSANNIKFSEEELRTRSLGNLWFSADQAIERGFAHKVGDFQPPPKTQIWGVDRISPQ